MAVWSQNWFLVPLAGAKCSKMAALLVGFSEPPADDIAHAIRSEYGNYTLDLKQHKFCNSVLSTLPPESFQMKCKFYFLPKR